MDCSILVIGHGKVEGTDETSPELQADILTEILGQEVFHAYFYQGSPSIDEALEEIAFDGPERLVVIPMYFAPGSHMDGEIMDVFDADLDDRMGRAIIHGREVPTYVTKVFTTDPRISDIVLAEVRAAVEDKEHTGVLIVAHGSHDGRNLAYASSFAKKTADAGYNVACCSSRFDPQSVPAVFSKMAAEYDKVVVLPMFASPSRNSRITLPPEIGLPEGKRSGTVDAGGRKVEVRILDEIGMSRGLAPILLSLIRDSGF